MKKQINYMASQSDVIQQQLAVLNSLSQHSTDLDCNTLLQHVASQCDAAATVYVYDYMKDHRLEISEGSWSALKQLEGKSHKGVYRIPAAKAGALSPERRIHKICKGPRTHERSEAAKMVLPQAISWLKSQDTATFKTLERSKQAKQVASALNVPLETARGVITKLKQKGLL